MDPMQLKAFKFPEFAFSINICFAIRDNDDKKPPNRKSLYKLSIKF